MSGIEVISLIGATVWLAALTLVIVLIVRQLGLVMARIELGGPVFDPSQDGLEIGTRVPQEVVEMLPGSNDRPFNVLLLSASCSPCHEIAAELGKHQVLDLPSIVVLITGQDTVAHTLAMTLPPGMPTVFDPDARLFADGLGLRNIPFVMRIEQGEVSGKTYVHKVADIIDLARAPELDIDERLLANVGKVYANDSKQ